MYKRNFTIHGRVGTARGDCRTTGAGIPRHRQRDGQHQAGGQHNDDNCQSAHPTRRHLVDATRPCTMGAMTTTPTEQADPQTLLLRLLDPASRADPYPVCAELRERGPLALGGGNFVLFSTYRDCDDVLRHPLSSSDQFKSTAAQQDLAADPSMRQESTPSFLFLDPPDHTRLRKLVSKAFAPKVVNVLLPEISELVDGLLDRIAAKGSFDVVEDFAYPLPVAVICRLLGVPLGDEPQF